LNKTKQPTFLLISLLVVNLLFGFYVFDFIKINGYLPPPFFFDSNDTMMDLYNPYFYSLKLGLFSEWKSIYTNFTFLILEQIFYNKDCILNVNNPFELRACDHASLIKYLALCFVCLLSFMVLIYKFIYKKVFSELNTLIFTAFILSSPVFYVSFERGNFFVVAAIILNLFLIFKSSFLRAFLTGLLINLKLYFLIMVLPLLLHEKLKLFIVTILFSILFYLFFFYLYFDDDSLLFFKNLFSFGNIDRSNYANFFLNLSFLRLLKILFDFYFLDYLFILVILVYCFNIFLARRYFKLEETLLMTLILGIILIPNFGFYFILAIMSLLISSMRYDDKYFFFLIFLLLPYDYFTYQYSNTFHLFSWIGDRYVTFYQSFSFGDIFRPLVVLLILIYQSLKLGIAFYYEEKVKPY